MVSVVCVYNDQSVLQAHLLKSLEIQTVDHELLLVDNRRGLFGSAAQALNSGGQRATGKYIMFVHQDVDLRSSVWLREVESVLDGLDALGVAGIAGAADGSGVLTVIDHDANPRPAGQIVIDKPTQVQTLDECLILVPRVVFDSLQFDEEACPDWHLYAVDYSLSVSNFGLRSYVIPAYAYHRSTGAPPTSRLRIALSLGVLPKGYYRTLGRVLRKHKANYSRIYTTNGDWSTKCPVWLQRLALLCPARVRGPLAGSLRWIRRS